MRNGFVLLKRISSRPEQTVWCLEKNTQDPEPVCLFFRRNCRKEGSTVVFSARNYIETYFYSQQILGCFLDGSVQVIVVENPAQGDASPLSCPNSLVIEEGAREKPNNPELETVSQNSNSAAQQSLVCCMHDEYQVETTDFPSDSESSDDFSVGENLELSWACSNNVGQNVAISDSSVSDDDDDDDDDEEEEEDGDDLIEISLPKNSSVDSNADSKQKLQSDLPEAIFKQEGLTELFADINEANEENLIEIDLSMGSIKCSTFEIEA